MSIPPDVLRKLDALSLPPETFDRLIAILEPAFGEFSLVGGDARPDDWPTDAWERFWQAYPSKIGKADAHKSFLRARKTRVPWERFWGGLQRYISKRDDRRWCNPSTWLNQQRWDDGPTIPNGGGLPFGENPSKITPSDMARGLFRRTP